MTNDPKVPKGTEIDGAPDWDLFGSTPRYIAAALGIRPELVLTYLTSTLGGLAGAFARMSGFLGERHQPTLPLILAERHPSKARSLCQLATGPAQHFNDWQRRKSQALSPELFEWHHAQRGSKFDQANRRLLDGLDEDFGNQDWIAAERSDLLRHRQNYQPSVLLTSPHPKTFDQLRGSVFDEHPLVLDPRGRLVRNVIQPHPRQKEWQELLELIKEGAGNGIDLPAGGGGPESLDDARRVRTPFLIHIPHELVGQMLLNPSSANLLEVGILLPTEDFNGRLKPTDNNYGTARHVVEKYRSAMNEVLWSRIDNSGVAYAMEKPIPELIEGQEEIHARIDSLPSETRRYCGGLIDLPLRLLWTAVLLDDCKAEHVPVFVPGVLQTARWCVERQLELVTEALEAVRRREIEEAARLMLRKLGEIPDLPCRFADLARKYRFQRKDLLEPVLEFLCNERVASWDPERNRIDLLECDEPPPWLADRDGVSTAVLTLPAHSPRAR